MKIHRVVVRGQFADLDDDIATALRESQAEHDIFVAAFTAEGTMTYDEQLIAFSIRYEVRDRDRDGERSTEEIGADAISRATAHLDERGIGCKHMRATVTDMASYWER